MPDDVERRIRAKAHALWVEEGKPEGRADVHWEKARTLVAIEDDRSSLKPVTPPQSEPLDVQDNLGELPGAFTDQGDRQQIPDENLAEKLVEEKLVKKPAPARSRKKR